MIIPNGAAAKIGTKVVAATAARSDVTIVIMTEKIVGIVGPGLVINETTKTPEVVTKREADHRIHQTIIEICIRVISDQTLELKIAIILAQIPEIIEKERILANVGRIRADAARILGSVIPRR